MSSKFFTLSMLERISQLTIEKQIWKRSSLDADIKIDELEAEVHRLREAIEKHKTTTINDFLDQVEANVTLYKALEEE